MMAVDIKSALIGALTAVVLITGCQGSQGDFDEDKKQTEGRFQLNHEWLQNSDKDMRVWDTHTGTLIHHQRQYLNEQTDTVTVKMMKWSVSGKYHDTTYYELRPMSGVLPN